ncbi:MAG: hypothetical protein ABSA50_03985 [Candidatus Bathyarchaeia archaeon]|jgi:hypothetical protein
MESKEIVPKSYHFTDPTQEWIYKKLLLLVGPGPALFYQDACSIMAESIALQSTTHLVGHLLREIESALRDVLEPIVVHITPAHDKDESAKHKAEILAILSYLDIPDSDPIAVAWMKLAGRGSDYALHARAHRRDLSAPRPIDQDFVRFWDDTQMILKIVLDKFETHYASVFDILDKTLVTSSPSIADIKQLRAHVPNNMVTWSYFFGRLQSTKWLSQLKLAGFFDAPPDPQLDDEKKTIRMILWPQSQYLARIASESPVEVVKIILDIPETENLFVHSDLVDAALAMPPVLAAEWAKKEIDWIEKRDRINFLLPQKLGELIGHLARGKQADAALELTRSLLGTFSSEDERKGISPLEPQARLDTWHYAQILQTAVLDLIAAAGEKALVLFCELLESAIQTYVKSSGPEDYSYLWRPAVEDSEQNLLSDPKELLVSAVRDSAFQIIKMDLIRLPAIVGQLEKRKWLIFQRIALHLLRTFPSGYDTLIAEWLADQLKFGNLGLWHEYSLLAQDHFGDLSLEDQDKILKWIGDGPDVKKFNAMEGNRTGKAPSKEEIEHYVKRWRLTYLASIHSSLPEKWITRYDELKKELGEPEHPEFLIYSGGGFGPTSPKNAQELQLMSAAEIVSFLKTWHPNGGFLASSPEGLGRVLSGIVSSNPARFAEVTNLFREIEPTYVRALLTGLREAVKQKHSFAWATILELCQWVMEQPRTITDRKDNFESDMGWVWTRKTIADLLSAGFETGPGELPYDLRNKAWNVLERITEDPDPTPEQEKANYDTPNMNPSELSINSVRGEAIHAVVRYALWVRLHLEKETDSEQRVAHGFDEMPEARAVLDAHLDPARESALAIRAIYGQWFPWLLLLDKRWAFSKVSSIFTHEANLRDFHDVAWEAYLVYCPPYNNVVDVLHEEYAEAVERLGEAVSKWRYIGADPRERLAEHLMILYWRGKLNLTDVILRRFFERASDNTRGHALSFVGRELSNVKEEIQTSTLERLMMLWEHRLETSELSKTGSIKVRELAAFGWWFASNKFDNKWALTQLSAILMRVDQVEAEHQVIKRLAYLVPKFPEQVIQCLSLMITESKGSLLVLAWREQVRLILGAGANSENPKARENAVILINRLTALGHLEFRDLINKTS